MIITAKPDEHQWGGLPFVTIDDDGGFSEAEKWFGYILAEINTRLVKAKRRVDVGNVLTVVLDDFTRLRTKCASAGEVIELLGDQGRSIRIRLILITRSKLVEALGIKGQGDWRDNLVFITLDRQRRAYLEWDNRTFEIDTSTVYKLSQQRISQVRAWEPPAATDEADKLLSRFFDVPQAVPVRPLDATLTPQNSTGTSGTGSTGLANAVPVKEGVPADLGSVPANLTPEAIRTLYTAWGSKNKIAALLTGTKGKRLAVIDAALEQSEESREVV